MKSFVRRTEGWFRLLGLAASVVAGANSGVLAAAEPPRPDSGAALTGRVLDAEGRPVAGANVRLHDWNSDAQCFAAARAKTQTDDAGSYRFDGLAEGYYALVAWAAGTARSYRSASVEQKDLSLDVVIRPPVVPEIELRDEQGRPVAGARVRDLRVSGDNGEFFLRRMDRQTFGSIAEPGDARGRLRLTAVPEGSTLTVTVDHHRQGPVLIERQAAADGLIATATMPSGVRLTLNVQPDGNGPGMSDLLIQLLHEPIQHAATIRGDRIALERDGTATLAVAAGDYQWLRLEHADYYVTPLLQQRVGREPLRIETGRNDRLTFRLHHKVPVRGRVVDARTGEPIAGMDVQGEIRNSPEEAALAGYDWTHADWAQTDENGEYVLPLAAGPVRISFEGYHYVADPRQVELDVAADGSTVGPDFRVQPLPPISGLVRNEDGTPADRVVVRFAGRFLRWAQPVLTDEHGRFELQPPFIPVNWETEEPMPEQPILAFHPHQPLAATVRVRLDDPESLSNVTLTLEKSDYESVLSDFAAEFTGWQAGDTSSVPDAAERLAKSLVGKPAPELDGVAWLNTERPQMSLADFRGRYVLLDFWFTGCGPCHADFPSVKLVHELYKDHGVTVIGVHDNSAPPEAVGAHAKGIALPFPIVVDHPDGRIEAVYREFRALKGFPSYVLIGPDGNVVHADYTVPAPSLRMNKLEIIRSYAMGARSRSDQGP